MHELSICVSMLNILSQQARQKNFHRVKKLWLEIGDLAGIELDALRFSFPIAAKHTIAKEATLEIIPVAGQGWCDECQNSVTLNTYFDPCLCCGKYNYQITQGKECRIVKMEVE